MKMHQEIEKEFQKLKHNIERDNRKLELMRNLLSEYNGMYAPAQKIETAIHSYLKEHQGHMPFEAIADFVISSYPAVSRQKISVILTKSTQIKYNKNNKEWEII